MTALLEQVHVYPVKGLRGIALQAAEVEPCGLAGDRRWLITGPDRAFLTQRDLPAMAAIDAVPEADGLRLRMGDETSPLCLAGPERPVAEVRVWHHSLPARAAGADASAWLSDRLGRPCLLWFMHDPEVRPVDPGFGIDTDAVSFADAFPILVVNTASLDALNAALGDHTVPIDRFRANLVVSGFPAWDEDRWRTIRIGAMTFRAPTPCARCVVITQDQRSGEKPTPGEPLKTLGRLHRQDGGITFGMNLIPDAPGRLAVGDPVEITSAASTDGR